MMRAVQNVLCCGLLLALVFAKIEARPQSALASNNQETDAFEPQLEDMRSSYYDFPTQPIYQNIPMEKLQMLVGQYRPSAFLHGPSLGGIDELYRMPESKRQVRYRQCYFNPISCFKK